MELSRQGGKVVQEKICVYVTRDDVGDSGILASRVYVYASTKGMKVLQSNSVLAESAYCVRSTIPVSAGRVVHVPTEVSQLGRYYKRTRQLPSPNDQSNHQGLWCRSRAEAAHKLVSHIRR